LRKKYPKNMSRISLSQKLYNELVLAGVLHHCFHIRSLKTEEEEEEN